MIDSRALPQPLTVEDVLHVIEIERPMGVIVQFGGQTPLKLAKPLQAALEANPIPSSCGTGFTRILGTPPDAIDAAEDRERFEARTAPSPPSSQIRPHPHSHADPRAVAVSGPMSGTAGSVWQKF